MTWRERQLFWPDNQSGIQEKAPSYERARFKDAPFWVESYLLDGGRRQSIQRFPGSVYTNVQDLGRDSSVLKISAFLIGDDYDSELRWLEGRLLEGGPGELVLPWREPFTVTVIGRVNVDETKDARGFATVSFECVETAEPPRAFQKDSAARMRNAAQEARGATRERFGKRFNAAGGPESLRVRIRQTMGDATTRIVGIQSKVSGFIAEIPKAANSVNQLFGAVSNLINTPLDLSDEIVNAVTTAYSALRSTSDTAENVIRTWGAGGPLRILADQTFRFNNEYVELPASSAGTYGDREQQNLNEFNRLCRLAMFYEMAELMADLAFESRGQALRMRTRYYEEIDPLLLGATPAEAEAIASLLEATGAFLEEVASRLPEISTYIPAATLPALVLAHIIYEDARAEYDIVLRNAIKHPGFVDAGVPLEVLRVN